MNDKIQVAKVIRASKTDNLRTSQRWLYRQIEIEMKIMHFLMLDWFFPYYCNYPKHDVSGLHI